MPKWPLFSGNYTKVPLRVYMYTQAERDSIHGFMLDDKFRLGNKLNQIWHDRRLWNDKVISHKHNVNLLKTLLQKCGEVQLLSWIKKFVK